MLQTLFDRSDSTIFGSNYTGLVNFRLQIGCIPCHLLPGRSSPKYYYHTK